MKRIVAVLACALGTVACSGPTDEPRPDVDLACRPLVPLADWDDPGSGSVACNALDGYELFLLDNFEPGEASIAWYTNNDRTALSDPPPETDPTPATPIPGGRCLGETPTDDAATLCDDPTTPRGQCRTVARLESRSAVHIRTGHLTNNGGQLGRSLPLTCPMDAPECHFQPGPPEVGPCSIGQGSTTATDGCEGYDLSLWDGVFVWARVGPNSANSIKLRVADKESDDKGCVCDPYTNQNDSSTGCDKFGTFVGLDGDFRVYFAPFDEMQQGGWGMRVQRLDTSGLFSFGIDFGRGSWDLWIDDVGFYRRRR